MNPDHPEDADWTSRKDWSLHYDPSVDTGSDSFPQAVVITACDAPYYYMYFGDPGTLQEVGINAIGETAYSRVQRNLDYFDLDRMQRITGTGHTQAAVKPRQNRLTIR